MLKRVWYLRKIVLNRGDISGRLCEVGMLFQVDCVEVGMASQVDCVEVGNGISSRLC